MYNFDRRIFIIFHNVIRKIWIFYATHYHRIKKNNYYKILSYQFCEIGNNIKRSKIQVKINKYTLTDKIL
jgi:hypothetical protein